MRVMIDTNIIISAALFPNGRAAQAFFKALNPPYQPLVCDYIVDELHRHALGFIHIVPTPEVAVLAESAIRDVKDRPILRAALDAHADLFLTGDKDFLESSVTDPRIINVSEFLER